MEKYTSLFAKDLKKGYIVFIPQREEGYVLDTKGSEVKKVNTVLPFEVANIQPNSLSSTITLELVSLVENEQPTPPIAFLVASEEGVYVLESTVEVPKVEVEQDKPKKPNKKTILG